MLQKFLSRAARYITKEQTIEEALVLGVTRSVSMVIGSVLTIQVARYLGWWN